MSDGWEQLFRSMLAERGYDDVQIHHDPMYGWIVNYGVGEFEAKTTVRVKAEIRQLSSPQVEFRGLGLPTEETDE